MTKWMTNNYFFVIRSVYLAFNCSKSFSKENLTGQILYFSLCHNLEMWKLLVILQNYMYSVLNNLCSFMHLEALTPQEFLH